jgi:hypothetical protein
MHFHPETRTVPPKEWRNRQSISGYAFVIPKLFFVFALLRAFMPRLSTTHYFAIGRFGVVVMVNGEGVCLCDCVVFQERVNRIRCLLFLQNGVVFQEKVRQEGVVVSCFFKMAGTGPRKNYI